MKSVRVTRAFAARETRLRQVAALVAAPVNACSTFPSVDSSLLCDTSRRHHDTGTPLFETTTVDRECAGHRATAGLGLRVGERAGGDVGGGPERGALHEAPRGDERADRRPGRRRIPQGVGGYKYRYTRYRSTRYKVYLKA